MNETLLEPLAAAPAQPDATPDKTLRPLLKEVYLGTLTGVFISLWAFFRNSLRLTKTLVVAFFRPTHISEAAVAEGRYLSVPMTSRITFEIFILFHVFTLFMIKMNNIKPLDAEVMKTVTGEITGVFMEIAFQAFYALSYFPGLMLVVLTERLWLKLTRNAKHRAFVEAHLIYSYNALFLFFALWGLVLRLGRDMETEQGNRDALLGTLILSAVMSLLHSLFLLWKLKKGMQVKRSVRVLSVLVLALVLTAIFISTSFLVISVSASV